MNHERDARVEALTALISRASSSLPEDVEAALRKAANHEEAGTAASHTLKTIVENVELAREMTVPMCQDTGVLLFEVDLPPTEEPREWQDDLVAAVRSATTRGALRQNTIESVSGQSMPDNIAAGAPQVHVHVWDRPEARVRLMLKGGGCENVGRQYSLPDTSIGAGRDLAGVRKAVLEAVWQAQGRGCAPGMLGVCIGGDRASGYAHAKQQLWRPLGHRSSVAELASLEETLLAEANRLGIGPMGMGGRCAVLDVKVSALSRLPASFFVTIAYMCWAARRQGVLLSCEDGQRISWLRPEELAE